MKPRIPKGLFNALWRQPGNYSSKGFTLLELLIAVFIGSIITSTMLYLVVEMLKVNGREETLTQTQQEMRRAADYITREISEAVYVYETPEAILDELDDPIFDDPNAEPILAFWRIDPLDENDVNALDGCASFTGTQLDECRALLVRQAVYTLVVYLHVQDTSDEDIWVGESRIARYALSKYQELETLTQTPGYNDPADGREYANWTAGADNTQGTTQVLTDQVAIDPDNSPNTDAGSCPGDVTTNPADPQEYRVFPQQSDSFYVCVRERTAAGGNNTNQSLVVYVQGRPEGSNPAEDGFRPIFNPASENTVLPRVKSEVLVRGVVGENPPQQD